MRALTHKDLANGLPPLAERYMRAFSHDSRAARDFKEFIGRREWKYEKSGGPDGEEAI
jgi:hypothetical protein